MAFVARIFLLLSPIAVLSKLILDNSDVTIWTIPDNVSGDAQPVTTPGSGLIGGGSDCIEAFSWQIKNSNKGDFVILRASGDDAYNPFVYELSNNTLNSVTTILFKNKEASFSSDVQNLLKNAEAIFFAGGDQNNYIKFWTDTPVQSIIQEKLKTVTIAGTSAGLAILGNWIYSATEGSAFSDESLENPYNKFVTIAPALFKIPYMSTFITDTHFSARERMGRLLTFMARIVTDNNLTGSEVHAMGVDEETALLLDYTTRTVTAVGKNNAYICGAKQRPAVCISDTPLQFEGIACTRLSARTHETFSLDIFAGQGVSYVVDIVDGKYTSTSLPYGPL